MSEAAPPFPRPGAGEVEVVDSYPDTVGVEVVASAADTGGVEVVSCGVCGGVTPTPAAFPFALFTSSVFTFIQEVQREKGIICLSEDHQGLSVE